MEEPKRFLRQGRERRIFLFEVVSSVSEAQDLKGQQCMKVSAAAQPAIRCYVSSTMSDKSYYPDTTGPFSQESRYS